MKPLILFFYILLGINIYAQEFIVEKISGDVKVLKGTSEEWELVKQGQKLSGSDVLAAENKSFIQLSKQGSRFILKDNAALGLDHIKQVSINDLLLALAMEEIRNVPKKGENGNTQNTAIYGSEVKKGEAINISSNDFGIKKLNGARQLANNGFKESAIIVAKETFRNYPNTQKNVADRIYFADLLTELKLYDEAYSELTVVSNLDLNEAERSIVIDKLEKLKLEFAK